MQKQYGLKNVVFDLFMLWITRGYWLVWVFIKFVDSNLPFVRSKVDKRILMGFSLAFDLAMMWLTRGAWFVWILVRIMRTYTRK